jgi:hypothetical protein
VQLSTALLVRVGGAFSASPCLFKYIVVETKLRSHLTAQLISDLNKMKISVLFSGT